MEAFGLYDQTGMLTVAVTPSFAAKWLVHRIEHFNRADPDVDIRMTTSMNLSDYARDGIEISVRYGKGDYGACCRSIHCRPRSSRSAAPGC